ncbi:flagellar biosynthetic protein FliO [Ignavibacteria bacterium 4148-Me]|uniref:FliO/MopB family protein n=1 Tax=Rosettibacter primus TaxID=3111523 RepID=UPI00336BB85E
MSFLDIIKTFLPLILIFGLLFFALLMVRKYSFSINGKRSKLLKIEVINNHLIMPKKYLSVVKVQDKILLLGISENSITLLKEYDYSPSLDDDLIQGEVKKTFLDLLKQNLGIR